MILQAGAKAHKFGVPTLGGKLRSESWGDDSACSGTQNPSIGGMVIGRGMGSSELLYDEFNV